MDINQDNDIKSAISEIETIADIKKVEAKEAQREVIVDSSGNKVSWLVRLVMKLSLGSIKNPKYAEYILMSLSIILILIAIALFISKSIKHPAMSIDLQNKIRDVRVRPLDAKQ